jgi:hypothetical protein
MIRHTIAFCTALLTGSNAIELTRIRDRTGDMTLKNLNDEIEFSLDHIQMIEDLSRISLEKN